MAYTFKDAVKIIEEHQSVNIMKKQAQSIAQEGSKQSSWGDPVFRVAAKNYPVDGLSDEKTPMTGLEFGIAQKIPLTTKYGNIDDAYRELSKSRSFEVENKKQELVKTFWEILIDIKKLNEEVSIISENINWIEGILKASKQLYRNGKITQQALLEIQIRKAELEASLSNKNYEVKEQNDRLGYLLDGQQGELEQKSIPWAFLNRTNKNIEDTKELSLKSMLDSKKALLNAAKLDYVPDLTISLGYTKRSNLDKNGDFVSAMVSFPLPFSDKKTSGYSQAIHEESSMKYQLENYNRLKKSEESRIKHQIEKVKNELNILNKKTLRFAENSKKISSKSYTLGDTSYIELLQSELKLQSLLLMRTNLKALLHKYQVTYKYLVGEKLYE